MLAAPAAGSYAEFMRFLTRHIRRFHLSTATRVAAVMAFLVPVQAWAVTAPPQPTLNRFPAPWIGYLVVFVLLALVLVASLLPSKRGHQD